jgi:hypothetical protein
MEAVGERRYSSYSFSTSALDGGEWLASRPGLALLPGKGTPVPIVQEPGWAPEPVWTQRLEEKFFRFCRGSNPNRPLFNPYSDTSLYLLSYPAVVIYVYIIYKSVCPVKVDGNWPFSVLNGDIIYCSVIFANNIRNISVLANLNVKTSPRRPKPEYCQVHKKGHLTPDSHHMQTSPDLTIGITRLFCVSCYKSRSRQTLILIVLYRTKDAHIQSRVKGFFCFIRYS